MPCGQGRTAIQFRTAGVWVSGAPGRHPTKSSSRRFLTCRFTLRGRHSRQAWASEELWDCNTYSAVNKDPKATATNTVCCLSGGVGQVMRKAHGRANKAHTRAQACNTSPAAKDSGVRYDVDLGTESVGRLPNPQAHDQPNQAHMHIYPACTSL